MVASFPCQPAASLPDAPRALEDPRVRRAIAGSLDAFNELVLEYQDRVYRQALWLMGDPDAAEDAAQESFIHAYRKLHTYHGGSFRAWLLRITHNYCLDQIYAARRHPSQPLEVTTADGETYEPAWARDLSDSPETQVERAQAVDSLTRAILRLPPRYRDAIVLVDLQELDYAEAAAVLRMPLGTLKSSVSRARNMLREMCRAWSSRPN